MHITRRWKPLGLTIALVATTVLVASCGGESTAQGTTGATRQAAGELREIDCPDGWGYGGLKVVNRCPGTSSYYHYPTVITLS